MTTVSPPFEAPPGFAGSFETEPRVLTEYSIASGPVCIRPDAVAMPRDSDDLAALIRWSNSAKIPLVPRGAGTGMPGGNVGQGVSVDLGGHFQGLHPVRREARTVFAEAGVTLGRVEAVALRKGLRFPPLPSSADRCTVGGIVANNASGARTFRYGPTRSWVDGLTVVLADGTEATLGRGDRGPSLFRQLHGSLLPHRDAILDGWPRVQKNSSGYALDQFLEDGEARSLIVGSEGTLAFVTGAVLRLAPLPSDRTVALLAVGDLDHVPLVSDRARALDASACEFFGRRFVELVGAASPASVEAVPSDAEAILLVELEDDDGERLEDLRRFAGVIGASFSGATSAEDQARLWAIRRGASPAIAAAADDGYVSTQFIEDSVVPPSLLPAYVRGVQAILEDAGFDGVLFGHAGDGNVHVNPLVPAFEPDWRIRLREALESTVSLVAELGGTLAGEHGDGRLRAPLLNRIWPEAAMQAFRVVKATLDPLGLLNPGVIIPLPGQDALDGLGAGWARIAGSRR